jgi:Cancer susceptibility candidate 1 N-terminus
MSTIEASHATNVKSFLKERQDVVDWNNYVACEPLPNPKIESDVNTYLALWEEEPISLKEEPSIEPLLLQIPLADTLLAQLEYEHSLASDMSLTKRVHIVHEQMLKLIQILFFKWDLTSQKILQHMDYFAREPSENFQMQCNFPGYAFGLWGNLTKNPRHKVIEFSECQMMV